MLDQGYLEKMLADCLADDVKILGLADKDIDERSLSGALVASKKWLLHRKTGSPTSAPTHRLVIEAEGMPELPTFSLDLHLPNTSPVARAMGLERSAAILYQAHENKVTHAFVGMDSEALSERNELTEAILTDSFLFVGPVLEVVVTSLGADGLNCMRTYFNDYTSIPTIG